RRRGGDDLLEVVEHEQRTRPRGGARWMARGQGVADLADDTIEISPLGRQLDRQGACDAGTHVLERTRLRQLAETNDLARRLRDLAREARFAHTCGAGDRDEPRAGRKEPVDLLHLALTAEEAIVRRGSRGEANHGP